VAAIKKIQSKVGSLFPTRLKHDIAKREKTAEIGAGEMERMATEAYLPTFLLCEGEIFGTRDCPGAGIDDEQGLRN